MRSMQSYSDKLRVLTFSSAQFSLLTDWVIGGTWRMIQQRPSTSIFCRRSLWTVLAWAGMSTLWCCPPSTSSADHGIPHPPRCPKGWLWTGCCCMQHARTMQVYISLKTELLGALGSQQRRPKVCICDTPLWVTRGANDHHWQIPLKTWTMSE